MLTLGIETSCDETSIAIVKDGREILTNIIHSQIDLHRKTGGVVPEVAAREHVLKILPVLGEALSQAGVTMEQIDMIAVTYGPGLLTSLLTGINTAMTLALVHNKPLVPVNHIEGHMYANWLYTKGEEAPEPPTFPLVVLTASGGHNELILWHEHGRYTFLGATLDDAAGEAFDKVARLLGLPYPGGPQIQKAAEKGDPKKYALPRAWVSEWDFSFSGLKTAVRRLVTEYRESLPEGEPLDEQFIADVAASFQEAVCEVLATKLARAVEQFGAKEAQLAGGVSANARLRAYARELLPPQLPLRFCTNLRLCTDNAAMIACAGFHKYTKTPDQYKKWAPIIGNPSLEITSW
ncbi:tRNA (adenosine(37)-N6)-threonylcarbamoyltransferase complex transferase subunit TsaD [Candidatus Peregrinibacteria bacterium CG_4_9_14_0_2_um_filter_53_11]|nr:MAG: tRNA (adenosine(37)-N6)-threonylcarbamoyltransferase complex transferase subunit TsaD [Candidatus Peregrinibacteria bacterium CG_4_9_14_0_2_um_filter_53_11]